MQQVRRTHVWGERNRGVEAKASSGKGKRSWWSPGEGCQNFGFDGMERRKDGPVLGVPN